MISRWKRREHQPARPLSNRVIALGAVIVLGIGAAAFTVLLGRYGGSGPEVELDMIRTAGGLMAGAGGAIALLLAARRQRSTELALEHERENAVEQRITELYTRAVDQLGADKAPVRLGGLHALERLAQNNPAQRQTIVDVLCAYLRMPYTPPEDQAPGEEAPADVHTRYEHRRQELQVRLTALRILTTHLKLETPTTFWADINLNLTEAHLHQLDLTNCHIHRARFDGARFLEYAAFEGAKFAEDAGFNEAEFAGTAGFSRVIFAGNAEFGWAKFAGYGEFREAEFGGYARFNEAEFTWNAGFNHAKFARNAGFGGAKFGGDVGFDGTKFFGTAGFRWAKFGGDAGFQWARFAGNTEFDGARVASRSDHVVLPSGWVTRAAQPTEEEGWLYVVRDEVLIEQPAEATGDPPSVNDRL